MDLDIEELRRRLRKLRGEAGLIRTISGIFDAAALGYDVALVGLAVAEDRIDDAGAWVASHPGVSHAYRRAGEVNLWFTLATSSESRMGLPGTVERIADRFASGLAMMLPTLRRYKLRVRLAGDAHDEADPVEPAAPPGAGATLDEDAKRAVRALSRDLPDGHRPFDRLAEAEGLAADALLSRGRSLLASGAMRRYAAVLRHRRMGANVNAMVVWDIPDERVDDAGAAAARFEPVSHAYLRPRAAGWPYNLYTMLHAADESRLGGTVEQLAAEANARSRAVLRTVAEYAKKRIALFDGAEGAWERQELDSADS